MLIDRLSWASTVATVAVMFFALVWLQPALEALSTSLRAASILTGALASAGVYRLLSLGFLWLFGRSTRLRGWILGEGFLEGTWVGHYERDGQHYFTVERIEQSSGQTRVNGREFDAKGKTRASWSSDTVSVDTERMLLIYAYSCTVFERKHVQEGLGVFRIIRESSGKAPTKLDGYAVDLIDGDRDPNTEYRMDDIEPVPDEQALAYARQKFGVAMTE